MRLPGAAVRVLALVIGLAAIALIAMTSRAVILGIARRPAAPAPSLGQPAGPPPTAEEYGTSARAILRPLADSVREGSVTAEVSAVASARRALMALVVPAASKDAHLDAVLALAAVEQDPASETARQALFVAIRALIE